MLHLPLWTTRRLSCGARGLGLLFEFLSPRSSVFLDVVRLGLFIPCQIGGNERSFVSIVELGFGLPDTSAYVIGGGRLGFEASRKERLRLRAAEETLRVTAFGLSQQQDQTRNHFFHEHITIANHVPRVELSGNDCHASNFYRLSAV